MNACRTCGRASGREGRHQVNGSETIEYEGKPRAKKRDLPPAVSIHKLPDACSAHARAWLEIPRSRCSFVGGNSCVPIIDPPNKPNKRVRYDSQHLVPPRLAILATDMDVDSGQWTVDVGRDSRVPELTVLPSVVKQAHGTGTGISWRSCSPMNARLKLWSGPSYV